ncbi:hypothetical protein BASA50_000657 [Batrachochytrium salamandrivorans]|uniref:U-box domain-containing protein n=1 Tax=Batrachochytrium salamandrivorans TaxID=1357716 RepID=A0ABQ8ET85_9FUNG|nr:hypothetical protein BASA60_007123 [Batrachochytrium salamandrivorans]KAH6576130.1 hypothetical protein BASA62_001569 [Batrachochytrium salamandrivorans]KAH6579607.1 hypothetical protein BASA61_010123 [Batrachochytrium salamandrivorans]KAH6586192.1 hypothetical protein BASA50_000657 [Batrachochytrium salamandrivorans]KAH9275957.1 hypothetical protein BASA83_001764 [Batrachochytrium salamandrivorans]
MDNDLIRQKRLNKLGGTTNSSSPRSTGSSESATPKSQGSPPANAGSSSSTSVASSVSTVVSRNTTALKPKPVMPTSTKSLSSTEPPVKSAPKTPKFTALDAFLGPTDQDWLHTSLCSIFQVSLKSPAPNDHLYLEDLVGELDRESIAPILSVDIAERVIYARLQLSSNSSPSMPSLFDYLASVWVRAHAAKNSLRPFIAMAIENPIAGAKAKTRESDITAVQALVVSYAGLVLNPDMIDNFPLNHTWGSGFLGYKLLAASDLTNLYPREFITEFVERFEDDCLKEILGYTLKSIVAAMREKSVTKDYMQPIKVLQYLVSFKPMANLISQLPDWNPDYTNARTIEVLPIMGPFFSRTGIFPDSDSEIPAKYFASLNPFGDDMFDQRGLSIGARNNADVQTAMNGLRDLSQIIHNDLFTILMSFAKAGNLAKEAVLSFISRVIKLNDSRGKMQVDRRQVSTDGFMYNLLHVCLKLCDPIMDSSFSKLSIIDQTYPTHTSRLDFTETTRILADKGAVDAHILQWRLDHAESDPAAPNFVTEIFFLTLAIHHYGILSTMRYYAGFVKELDEMRKQANKFKAVRDSGAWTNIQPFVRNANEEGLQRLQGEVDKLVGVKLTMDAALMHRPALEHSLRFYSLVMMFLIRAACGVSGNNQRIAWDKVARGMTDGPQLFPLPATPPVEFSVLPEWIIEDICEFYLFILKNNPVLFENHPRDEIMTFSIVFLSNPTYIKNPYLKSKLVEILFYFTIPLYRSSNGVTRGAMDGVFLSHPMARAHLVRSTLGFYVDVEQTGMHSQFYDKFNIRYNISQIIKSVWSDPAHRLALVQASRDKEFFVKFVALLMNDTTYLLDEGLSKLKEIGGLQSELAVPLPENASNEVRQARQERESLMSQNERQALSYMSLSNETVHMLQYMTSHTDIVEPFMSNEIVERLAAMLDFNLVALAGPRCTELRVANPEKYRFDPKKLLSELVGIFIHLADRQEFVLAVAKDGRSFSTAVFDRAISILSKHRLKNEMEIAKLVEFVNNVEKTLLSEKLAEEEMGDVPDQFLDPLLYTLMEDPVILPSSGVTIDLSTIKSHLLSDAHDPFNRQALTIDQVKPDLELKEKIRLWRAQRKHQSQTLASDTMDTTL